MISSIGVVERRSASEHKSEIEFEFRVEVVVEFVFEVVVELSCCLSSRTRATTVTAWKPQFKVDTAAAPLEVLHEKR